MHNDKKINIKISFAFDWKCPITMYKLCIFMQKLFLLSKRHGIECPASAHLVSWVMCDFPSLRGSWCPTFDNESPPSQYDPLIWYLVCNFSNEFKLQPHLT